MQVAYPIKVKTTIIMRKTAFSQSIFKSKEVGNMPRKGENIFKRVDGRWEGRFIKNHTGGKAVYGYVYGKSYKEVKEKKSEAIAKLSTKPARFSESMAPPTVETIAIKWLDDLKAVRKSSTIVKYQYQLESHIIPYLGICRIDEVSNDDIVAFSNHLLTKKSLAPKTVSDILSRMKSIRKYAVIHGYSVGFHPECITIPQTNEEIRVLSFAEEEALLDYLWAHPDLTSLGILVCLFTGIRIGELCALMWSDISLSEKELHIKRTLQRLKNLDENAEKKTYISIDEPKSKCSIRTVPIPDNIIDALHRAYVSDGYLLTGSIHRFVEPRTMENRFKNILTACGIADANYHALRHSYATRCIEAGVDIKALSEMLGHANVNITLNRYVHPTMQFKHENVKKLSELFVVK